MADSFLYLDGAVPKTKSPALASTGITDAGRIVALNADGVLDLSLLPPSAGDDIAQVLAGEALTAGDFVNVWNDAGVAKCRKADASTLGKHAHGFISQTVDADTTVAVHFERKNVVTGAVPGDVFLSATIPGGFSETPPSASGQVVQRLGVAISATEINVECGQHYYLA